MVEVRFTRAFQRRLKALKKRYRQIQTDIQPAIEALQAGQVLGDRIAGTQATIFKLRAKNSDIPTGKRGGYRMIYQLLASHQIVLLLIYAKSDRADVSLEELESAVNEALEN